MSSISLHDQHASHTQNFRFNAPAMPPPPLQPQSTSPSGMGYPRFPNGTGRGPLPPVPTSNTPWGGNDVQLVQDVYGHD